MENKKKIIISILLIITLIGFIIYMIIENYGYNEINIENTMLEALENDNTEQNNIQNQNSNQNSIENNKNNLESDTNDESKIIVHVTGEVKKEGIVYLEKGARVADAIEKAGGETKEADLSQINLAYQLQDGQKIYVPNKNEKISEYITDGNGESYIENNNSNRKGEKSEYKYCKSK